MAVQLRHKKRQLEPRSTAGNNFPWVKGLDLYKKYLSSLIRSSLSELLEVEGPR